MSPSLPAIRRVSMLVLVCLLFQFLPVHSPLASTAVEARAPVPQVTIGDCFSHFIEGNTFIEAENYSILSSEFEVVESEHRSEGKFIRIPDTEEPHEPTPEITFNVEVMNGGTFYVWLLGYGPDTQSDSFFLRVDDGEQISAVVPTEVWDWSEVNDTITLSEGTQTLTFSEHEPGASLDKILLTQDDTYEPSGLGETADHCIEIIELIREQPPRPPIAEDTPAAPDTARAALLEAIEIVDELAYDGPPESAPECSTRDIRRTLQSTVDGTFLSDNFLAEEQAYDAMDAAVACLQAILDDEQVDDTVQDQALEARNLVLAAARLIPDQTLSATDLFGTDLPSDITAIIDSAQQEIATGDDHLSNSAFSEAITAYRTAWGYVQDALNQLWTAYDPDADFLLDEFETAVGTSTTSGDTDGDGISDGDELLLTGTDPLTDDSSSDLDSDGLTAAEEVAAATNPIRADTDSDSLDDRFELEEFKSDPRLADTDADGLRDDSELRLGTDPRNADSDGNGTLDGAQSYTSEATSEAGDVAVELTGIGDVAGTVTFQHLISNTLFQNMPGQIGTAVDITADAPFEQARVEIGFDPADVPEGDVENLRILYYDEDAQVFKPTDGGYGVDASTGVAWAETSHFTTFVLFYIPNWNTVWTYEMEPGRDPTDPVTKSLDVMLVIDDSGSMLQNDPNRHRLDAAESFIDALLSDDRVGFVEFGSVAWLWNKLSPQADFGDVKIALNTRIKNDNLFGTCIGPAITLATNEIVRESNADRLKAQIVLTDGDDAECDPVPDYSTIIAAANQANIQLYTIGLIGTGGVNEQLLQRLAGETGGQYYSVTNAADLPNVFRRINEDTDPDLDTDGDGLPDELETEGIRTGTGAIVTTDPAAFDTDGDGLSDGEEVGTRQTGPDGDYYDGITNPINADSDDDGLLDSDEVYGITNPVNADTDGDGLNDLIELYDGFDPLDANPDGDSFDDAEELARDTDPFHYNLTGLDYFIAFSVGFAAGEGGQDFAKAVGLPDTYIQSFAFIAGWIASGLFLWGDIRDTVIAFGKGDIPGALFNALAFVPVAGDAAKIAKVFADYIRWFDNLRGPLARWAVKQFGDGSAVASLNRATFSATEISELQANTTSDVLRAVLRALGLDDINVGLLDDEIEQLARSGNRLDEISQLLRQTGDKFKLVTRSADSLNWRNIDDAVNQNWQLPQRSQYPDMTQKQFNRMRGRVYAWARSTEAANEFLISSGYDVLYIGRQNPIELVNNEFTSLSIGPDIIAVNPVSGKTVVVEIKGSVNPGLTLTEGLITSSIDKQEFIQPSLPWLLTENQRYLRALDNAKDPKIKQAANRLRDIINNGLAFETIVFTSGPAPTSLGSGVDNIMKALDNQTTSVQILTYNWP